MRNRTRDAFLVLCASAFAITVSPPSADASSPANARAKPAMQASTAPAAGKPRPAQKIVARAPLRSGGPILQCVTFARDVSGIHLSGNAHTWWHAAAGRFARGQRPEVGAVLNFRASGGMRMGHVSVVSRLVSAREILIDDANWAIPGQRKGMVRRGASVIDVSPDNDWTEVRVANGIGTWGRVYPTYGFIYPRADHGHGTDRIEIAATREALLTALPPAARTRAAAVTPPPAGGWIWQGTMAVQANPAAGDRTPTPRRTEAQHVLRPPPAEPPRPPGATRWTWVNGQAVARD